jgi:hypothetical protein
LAQLASDASYAAIKTRTLQGHNYYSVVMDQVLVGTWSKTLTLIGCDVQQNYLVDATTFAVKYEPGCLPG